jgi:hypothetical protein
MDVDSLTDDEKKLGGKPLHCRYKNIGLTNCFRSPFYPDNVRPRMKINADKIRLTPRGGRVTPLSAVRCPLSVDQIGISVKSCPLMAER